MSIKLVATLFAVAAITAFLLLDAIARAFGPAGGAL